MTTYADFRVRLLYKEDGPHAQIDGSLYGDKAASAPLPIDLEDLPRRLDALDSGYRAAIVCGDADRDGDRECFRRNLEKFGSDLHGALTAGDVGQVLHRTQGQLDGDADLALRIRISSDPRVGQLHALAAAPWETLIDPDHRSFFGLQRRYPISRYLEGLKAVPPLEIDGPLKVLIASASPAGTTSLDETRETQEIRSALASIPEIEVSEAPGILEEIRDRVLDEGIHVLHLIGHGNHDPHRGENWTTLRRSDSNYGVTWFGHSLANRLKGLPTLKLVVLSSCYGGALPRHPNHDSFHHIAPSILMETDVAILVGMYFPITNDAARVFSSRFYRRLVRGDQVDVAVAEARLSLEDPEHSDTTRLQWMLPMVFTRNPDATLITPEAAARARRRPPGNSSINPNGLRSTPSVAPPLRIRISSFEGGYGETTAPPDRELDLTEVLDGRTLRDGCSWNTDVLSRVLAFVEELIPLRRKLILDFAAPWSVAFAAGWALEVKSGVDLEILQRRPGGGEDFYSYSQQGSVPDGPLWLAESLNIGRGDDLAVAISLSRYTAPDVLGFLKTPQSPAVGRLLHLKSPGELGPQAVENGIHALQLAQKLDLELSMRSVQERHRTLHLFGAAPNAFTFFLGQLARMFGPTQLYEYTPGEFATYRPSLRFPPA